ncbi:P63C domain-containing protein [Catenulispora rubra]|uniref:P63C domain-containing protein n=1 Tax=Catenulispora rubra TaxID=280293 RepID=UPI0018921B61|nr:P63C domain-containing protein [Catenulispora rubra]
MTTSVNESASEKAAELSKLGASKGGIARARSLDSETRSAIAARAAAARWGDVQIATNTGELSIGSLSISCAVLEDGTRLVSQSAVLRALGRNPDKSRRTRADTETSHPPFLSANNLQPFIPDDLRDLEAPIPYRVKGESGRAWGYRAEMLPLVCEVYLEARRQDVLFENQQATARAAEILLSGLARVGIVALVDEATGYQETRAARELQLILENYVQAELRPWVKMFPDEFFKEIYRLHGWDLKPNTTKRTPLVGKLINKFIYEQLPPGVLEELQRRNPRLPKGYRAHKHHQLLTPDTGNVHLDRQISTVTTLMRISTSRSEFDELFTRAFPPAQAQIPLVIDIPKTTA